MRITVYPDPKNGHRFIVTKMRVDRIGTTRVDNRTVNAMTPEAAMVEAARCAGFLPDVLPVPVSTAPRVLSYDDGEVMSMIG